MLVCGRAIAEPCYHMLVDRHVVLSHFIWTPFELLFRKGHGYIPFWWLLYPYTKVLYMLSVCRTTKKLWWTMVVGTTVCLVIEWLKLWGSEADLDLLHRLYYYLLIGFAVLWHTVHVNQQEVCIRRTFKLCTSLYSWSPIRITNITHKVLERTVV